MKRRWKESYGPGKTVTQILESAIRARKTNEEAVAEVLRVYPHAQTSVPCARFHRARLRRTNKGVPLQSAVSGRTQGVRPRTGGAR